ncbi:hypothetical protein DFH11DRAFT_1834166 [Phellopilus nigrolimitatus]|nr:hypothetical protein DFH11DRAFT_1834166 [Phellopilus nigrolimitatus]
MAASFGRVIFEITDYVKMLKSDDGTPMSSSLNPTHLAPNPLFRTLAFLFSRTQTTVPSTRPSVLPPRHCVAFPDADAVRLLVQLATAHRLAPPTAAWLATWELLFACGIPSKPEMRRAVHMQLACVYERVWDLRSFSHPLADLLFEFWMQRVERTKEGEDTPAVWELPVHQIMVAMMSVSGDCGCDGELDAPAKPANTAPVSPATRVRPAAATATTPAAAAATANPVAVHARSTAQSKGAALHAHARPSKTPAARARVLRGQSVKDNAVSIKLSHSALVSIPPKSGSIPKLVFSSLHPLTVLLLATYLYTDDVPALWDRRIGMDSTGMHGRAPPFCSCCAIARAAQSR